MNNGYTITKLCVVLFIICISAAFATTASAELVINSVRYVEQPNQVIDQRERIQQEIQAIQERIDEIQEKRVQLQRNIKILEKRIAELKGNQKKESEVPIIAVSEVTHDKITDTEKEVLINRLRKEIQVVSEKIARAKERQQGQKHSAGRTHRIKRYGVMAPQLSEIISDEPTRIVPTVHENRTARHINVISKDSESAKNLIREKKDNQMERKKVLSDIREKIERIEAEIIALKQWRSEFEVHEKQQKPVKDIRQSVESRKEVPVSGEKHGKSGMIKDSTAVLIIVIITLLGIFLSSRWLQKRKGGRHDY